MSTSERQPLTGGVSCDVWIERDELGRAIVVKEPLSKLNVAAEWRSNPNRFAVEARALVAVGELCGVDSVPRVLWVDDAHRRFAMELIDPRFRNWKSDLLKARIDLNTAARVGEWLGILQSRSALFPNVAREFADRTYFEELRIEPFFERVAKKNGELASAIAVSISEMRKPGTVLVHGDFSPKNMLVDGRQIVILDFEIAHFGNPRFDVAFCVSHLLLKGMRVGCDRVAYLAAIQSFLRSFCDHGNPAILDDEWIRIVGCLLLARFDGASPVEYRDQLAEGEIRMLAREFILDPHHANEAGTSDPSIYRVLRGSMK